MNKVHYSKKVMAGVLIFASLLFSQLPSGFAVWSEGDAANRTIYKRVLNSNGTMGPPVKAINKGSLGGDIESQISFDGKWLAFARSMGGTANAYGGDDYHTFDRWEIYIARIDGNLPATPIFVGRGYWPSWGEDSYNGTKTLYYSTHFETKTIRKVTINDQGIVSGTNVKHKDVPTKLDGKDLRGFVMASPNGKFVAWRASGVHIYFFEDWMGKKAGEQYYVADGCHPSITSDSRWMINATKKIARVGKVGATLAKAGSYHYGTSADLNWFVTRTEGGASVQNLGYNVSIYPVKIAGQDGSKSFNNPGDMNSADFVPQGNGVSITSKGSWPDIHVYNSSIPSSSSSSAQISSSSIVVSSSSVIKPSSSSIAVSSSSSQSVVSSYRITSVFSGKTYKAGDTLTLQWQATGGDITGAFIEISQDGRNWVAFNEEGSVLPTNANWGNYKWIVQSVGLVGGVDPISLVGNNARIRIMDYTNGDIQTTSDRFTIAEAPLNSNVNVAKNPKIGIIVNNKQLQINRNGYHKTMSIVISNLIGKTHASYRIDANSNDIVIINHQLERGVYVLRYEIESRKQAIKIQIR